MCKFCDNVSEYRSIKIPTRTTMGDDNICELVMDNNCTNCSGCADDNNYFELEISSIRNCIEIQYYHKMGNIIIAPVSSRFCINYCPMCGKQVSKGLPSDELKFW